MIKVPSSLASHRLRRGWSQEQLAQTCAVSRTEISAIETGRLVPSVGVALRLATALGESVESLFGGAETAPGTRWAWLPRVANDVRVWRASVNGRLLIYPVEPTAAGTIPHDGLEGDGGVDVVSADARPDRTLVMAGCDPLAALLIQPMALRYGIRVLPILRSGSEALALLKQGLVHVAGIHFTDRAGRLTNDQAARASLGLSYCLLHQLRWDAGIAVHAQRRERSAQALLRAKVRWVNREEGSAARRTFDELLGSRRPPQGYGHIVTDHRAVAATVSSGWAEAGICVRPAAGEAHVRFIPLQQEAYELCIADALLDDPRITALVSTLRSVYYRRLVSGVPGCVSSETGDQRAIA